MHNNWGSQLFNDLRNRKFKTQDQSWLSRTDLEIRNTHIPVQSSPCLLKMRNKHERQTWKNQVINTLKRTQQSFFLQQFYRHYLLFRFCMKTFGDPPQNSVHLWVLLTSYRNPTFTTAIEVCNLVSQKELPGLSSVRNGIKTKQWNSSLDNP